MSGETSIRWYVCESSSPEPVMGGKEIAAKPEVIDRDRCPGTSRENSPLESEVPEASPIAIGTSGMGVC